MLGHNETQLDSYNKNAPQAHGTLIANWFEERVHRDTKGQARAVTKTHLPKKHEDLLITGNIPAPLPDDDTKYRILGDTAHPLPRPENYHYGKGLNKADSLQKTGKKHQLLEQLYLREVKLSLEDEERRKEEEARRGSYETTSKASFHQKPLDQNRVGRLVMYDQNGVPVPPENVDYDLRESLGFRNRDQISSDEELKRLIDTDVGYERQEAVTFWREKLEEGTYYMSKTGGGQPFAKNNQFLKTFKHYKHYKD